MFVVMSTPVVPLGYRRKIIDAYLFFDYFDFLLKNDARRTKVLAEVLLSLVTGNSAGLSNGLLHRRSQV